MTAPASDTRIESAKKRLTARLVAIRAKAITILSSGDDRERAATLQRIKKNISQ